MKKSGGQKELVDDMLPELKDDETARKLDEMYPLDEDAKRHAKLKREIKESIKGFVLGLKVEDQAVGRVRIGDYVLPFTVKDEEETDVSFTRGGKKKVLIRFKPEDDEEE